MQNMQKILLVISLYGLINQPIASRSSIIIDDFDAGAFSTDGVGTYYQDTSTSHVIGGRRAVSIGGENNEFLPHSSASLTLGNGYLEYNRQQNGDFILGYGSGASQPINVDLTANGENCFVLNTLSIPSQLSLRITVTDNTFYMNSSQRTFTYSLAGQYVIPYSAFTPVDFSKVGSVTLDIISFGAPFNGSGIYQFESFMATVPEPEQYCLICGFILAAIAVVRRLLRKRLGADNPRYPMGCPRYPW